MHRLKLLLLDLVLIALSTVFALVLRDNFEISLARQQALVPYLLLTLAVAGFVLPLLGISRSIWRFTAMPDYLRLAAATLIVVLGALALGFVVNRLDGVPRAVPVLQGLMMLVSMVGLRVLARVRHAARGKPVQLTTQVEAFHAETVLVVGLTRLTDLYLRSVAEFASDRIRIAGLLGRSPHHTGRFVHRHRVLGTPDQVADAVRDLEVHGVFVDRIVVTSALDKLTEREQVALLGVEKASGIRVEFIAEQMGLGKNSRTAPSGERPKPNDGPAFLIGSEALEILARRQYWRIKRGLDIVAAVVLLIVLAPVLLVASVLAAIDVGLPVTFWQQRPGLGGHPFKLYKLRTMAAAHDVDGRLVPESERLSAIGRFLRRTRVDELPQILNILTGEMSFIGPRPLLPADQPPAYAARLLVRPGLTGWAQVKGGRDLSAANKAALDLWYVQNASLALDLEILLRTVQMLVSGERINATALRVAWRDLQRAGICSSRELATGQHRFDTPIRVTGAENAA